MANGYPKERYWNDIYNQLSARVNVVGAPNANNFNVQPYIGRLGDTVNFADLPAELQTPEMAAFVGAVGTPEYDGTEACGSPGEVASAPVLGNIFPLYSGYRYIQDSYPQHIRDKDMYNSQISERASKRAVWNTIAVHAPDQLRQRVAWGLSQIFPVGVIAMNTGDMALEKWTVFYVSTQSTCLRSVL